jgi:hypothetical protein
VVAEDEVWLSAFGVLPQVEEAPTRFLALVRDPETFQRSFEATRSGDTTPDRAFDGASVMPDLATTAPLPDPRG